MKFIKKGQGLSLNTIIIAAIVLIVLVVLWAIFTGRMGGFTAGLKECRGYEGNPDKGCPTGTANYPGTNYELCCIEIEKIEGAKSEEPMHVNEYRE